MNAEERIQSLLESNNTYLQRARDAEAKVRQLERAMGALISSFDGRIYAHAKGDRYAAREAQGKLPVDGAVHEREWRPGLVYVSLTTGKTYFREFNDFHRSMVDESTLSR